jgi:hypothetical protein
MVNANGNTEAISPQETLAKADSVLPRFDWDDEKKRKYLSYRLCGFSRDEARAYAGSIDRKTIYNWMERDEEFASIETTNLLQLQRTFSKEVITLDYTRNFKLVLDHDYQVLKRANEVSKDPAAVPLTAAERSYLAKIRPLYTPQQFAALQDLFKEFSSDTGWDEMIIMARRNSGKEEEGSNDSQNGGFAQLT